MSEPGIDLELLRRASGAAAARYLGGGSDRFDALALLALAGADDLDQLSEEPDAPAAARQLARMAAGLAEATRRLGGAEVEASKGPMPRAAAWAELARSADEERLRAVARALAAAEVAALAGPLDEAYHAARDESWAQGEVAAALGPANLEPLLAPPPVRTVPTYRLVVSRLSPAPAPSEVWRAELRDLIQGLLEPHGASLGVGPAPADHGPAAFCARHPRHPGRYTLFCRPSDSLSVARSLATCVGVGVAQGCGRVELAPALGMLFAARLASPALWRRVGLGTGPARDAARGAGQSALRLLARLAAFLASGEEEARAMAAAAGALLGEHDDVAGALRWRGPYPDPLGLPLPCGRARLAALLAGAEHGLRLHQGLLHALGDDWHRAPEAVEQLWALEREEQLPAAEEALAALVEV